MRKYLIITGLIFSLRIEAQVLNVESQRFQSDSAGWIGNLGLSFSVQQNVVQFISIGNNAQVQYKKGRSRFLFLSNVAFTQIGGTNFDNTGFQHIRYNYKINERVTWEALVQAQYNQILKMDYRLITGTGPRIKVFKNENFATHIGIIYLYEDEKITDVKDPVFDSRLSIYLSLAWKISKDIEFISTTFYQPNLVDISDYRIATNNLFEIDIHKHFTFKTGFDLLYDTRQPAGIPNLTYNYMNSLSWKF
jgi:hypothetical protein